jgi:formylglycine-generating enzyme required for sulfatase activity
MRTGAINDAVKWVNDRPRDQPEPGPIILQYIEASKDKELRDAGIRKRFTWAVGALSGLLVIGGAIYYLRNPINREIVRARHFHAHALAQDAVASLKPGSHFRECSSSNSCPEMVVLPAGSFDMGSSPTTSTSKPLERPLHQVEIKYKFAVSQFEITHDQWSTCVETSPTPVVNFGCSPISDSGYGLGDKPAINVSWNEVQQFVAWLNYMTTGQMSGPYRLLSEAEWEYAARAGTTTEFYWGDDPDQMCQYANGVTPETAQRYPVLRRFGEPANCEDGYLNTSPVGAFQPNMFGLFDMHGNIFEWVQDCWNENYDYAPKDGSVWTGGDCTKAVLRGGAWNDPPVNLRSAHRFSDLRTLRDFEVGFRLARQIDK